MPKLYNPDTKSIFFLQFGFDLKKINVYKKVYKRIDKRTKKFGNQRKHDGQMGKYKTNA